MLGSTVVEVAIGLALVYLMFSILCSAISEWIARFLALRATGLAHGISELFNDADFTNAFHAHALIDALRPEKSPVLRRFLATKDSTRYPSYISARTFALAVMDLATDMAGPVTPGEATRAVLKTVPQTPAVAAAAVGVAAAEVGASSIPKTVAALLKSVNGDAAAMQARLEDWFNDSMSRVSGWYKRRTQVMLFVIGLVVAAALNIDSFSLARQLVTEPAVREALVKQAGTIVQQAQPATRDSASGATTSVTASMGGMDSLSIREIKAKITQLQQAGLVSISAGSACSLSARFWPWSSIARSPSCNSNFEALVGILLTTVALSFGAPFWFDAVNKLVNLRQAGAPPEGTRK
jgi:hypothetical protein